MKTFELVRLAIINMRQRKTRTMLTILGVIIGTACIILMFSVGLSNLQQFEEMLEDSAALTQIQLYAGSGQQSNDISKSKLNAVSQIEHVEFVSPVLEISAKISSGEYEAEVILTGVEPSIIKGAFSEGDVFGIDKSTPEFVLGAMQTKQFINPKDPPDMLDYENYLKYEPEIQFLEADFMLQLGGSFVEQGEASAISPLRVKASGILQPSDATDYKVFMDITQLIKILMQEPAFVEDMGIKLDAFSQALVNVDDMQNVEFVIKELHKLGFEVYSPTEYIQQMQEEQARQQGQLLMIGCISLLVSAIGIANTMYTSILEQKKDVGIMKVVGVKAQQIQRLFLIESAVIGLLGGCIGAAVSYIAMLLINTSMGDTSFLGMYFSEGMSLSIPIWLVVGAILFSMLIGIISGIYPARKATKISPLEAMRS